MQLREVVITSALRTAIGDFGGALKERRPSELAAHVVAELVKRSEVDPLRVGHCVFGNVLASEPRDLYLPRVAALKGGLPDSSVAMAVNRLCGSGLQAVISAAQQIQLGVCEAAIAGGAESMSRAPYLLPAARFGQRLGDGAILDMVVGALTCPINRYHMGITAENLAERYGITREQQDGLALESHRRAARAIAEGRFGGQIVPLELKSRKGSRLFDTDEHVRHDCTPDELAALRPAFKHEGGTVTAGNASGLNDAAAALLLMDRECAEASGQRLLARLVDYQVAGVAPDIMGIGPVPAVRELLARNGLGIHDIDFFELNEAFAAQALAVTQQLDLPPEKVNPNGSGISLGHPIGATGAILMVKAVHELQRTGGRFAVVSLCIGGGQGIAALLERL
ncbi:beta-ketothiolase BktB [Stutzerimonas nitrititolerans]|uniref:beta-ketothiolase BktB n=1 Tax=Stutzerimonas nitrititolerans TaxID=2482751 RepID=UPI00289A0E32|nr:beta-ketothiolase BktB [Stutzerimonas nitrititolerans]